MKPGQVQLGTLTVGGLIGRGGYGEVYKARLAPFGQDFAVKFLDPSPFHNHPEKAHERFVKEAEILMALRHQYIVPIYGVGEHEGRPYILMEYFDGYNLCAAREKSGAPSPRVVLSFVERVAEGLGYAHQRGVVHRDIKPSNLLTRQGDARVIDFGIAKIMDPEGVRFTETGGTPVGDAYAAPELIADPRLIDPRCDVYSLGACWFWLLTGTTPQGRNWEAALRAVDQMEPQYEQVLLKALDRMEARYQTMGELVADVQALRSDANPRANSAGELDDNAALVLGVLFEAFSLESSRYQPTNWNSRSPAI